MGQILYFTLSFSSLFYQEGIRLRQQVLRTPLGKTLEFDQTKTDHTDWHLGAYHHAQLIGIVSLTPRVDQIIQMRQMAVNPYFQGSGIGYKLARKAEHMAGDNGYHLIYLDAREHVVAFYRKLSYQTSKGPFYKVGIPHYQMFKQL